MRCPKCEDIRDKVVDSRSVRDGMAIRRRRVCLSCRHRFTTYEEIVKSSLRVVKRDLSREEFSRQKLLEGVLKACEKRPVDIKQVEDLVDAVVSELDTQFDKEIPSAVIGEKVMTRLEKLDEVAYVRFASVYRRFKDINQFLSEVKGLIGKE
ncbi:MAG: transcriptional repressor NrdR [Lentisphaerae bacterium]|nr:transcriptional repressor NrdR [Lentisphaerota bacterium]